MHALSARVSVTCCCLLPMHISILRSADNMTSWLLIIYARRPPHNSSIPHENSLQRIFDFFRCHNSLADMHCSLTRTVHCLVLSSRSRRTDYASLHAVRPDDRSFSGTITCSASSIRWHQLSEPPCHPPQQPVLLRYQICQYI